MSVQVSGRGIGASAAARVVDELVSERVLAFGSVDAGSGDLDLLVDPRAEEAVAAGLAELKAARVGRAWLLPGPGGLVELTPAANWALEPAELERLLSDSTPVPGLERICVPAPHDELLILARRAIYERRPSRTTAKRAAELIGDAGACDRARSNAPKWGAARALECIEMLAREGRISALCRAHAVAARTRSEGAGAIGALAAGIRVLLPRRPRRGVLIALSGLDGSGKSSQAADVAEIAGNLGARTSVIWSSASQHPPWLHRIADLVRRVISSGAGSSSGSVSDDRKRRGAELRRRSRLLTVAWSAIVTGQLAVALARRSWPTLLRGGVVICDRYVLDSAVHLHFHFGEAQGYGPQLALLRALTPRPDLAYLLDVTPEVATSRKADFDEADNAERARLYRRLGADGDVTIVDGAGERSAILAMIATDMYALLRERGIAGAD